MQLNQDSIGSVLCGRIVATAAVVVALLGLTAPRASAGPITCSGGYNFYDADPNFLGDAYRCESATNHYDPGPASATYFFDGGPGTRFDNTLSFSNVLTAMDITMSAFFVDPANSGNFLNRIPAGYIPELFSTTDGARWIYFRVEDLQVSPNTAPRQGFEFSGGWQQTIDWFGYGGYNNPKVLHDSHIGTGGNTFAADITVPDSFDPNPEPLDPPPDFDCTSFCDPRIVGGANDFSDTLVVDSTTVPEPASLLLLGSGLGSALYRRRRQRALAARDSS
jgi:hypothetical protein